MNQNMEEKIKATYMNAFCDQDKNKKNMFLMVSKSLKNDPKTRTVEMDLKRFECELEYFDFYKESVEYSPHLNMFIPVILASKNAERRIYEIERLVGSYYGHVEKEIDFDCLLSGHVYSLIVDILLEDADCPVDEIVAGIKTFLIEYRPNIEFNKLQTIRFEMSRINMIKCMDPIDPSQFKDKTIAKALLDFLAGYESHDYENPRNETAKTLRFLFGEDGVLDDPFAASMAEYVFKLREFKMAKGEFSGIANPMGIKSLEKGAVHDDPVFNRIIVTDRAVDETGTRVSIKSKAGEYVFRFE